MNFYLVFTDPLGNKANNSLNSRLSLPGSFKETLKRQISVKIKLMCKKVK